MPSRNAPAACLHGASENGGSERRSADAPEVRFPPLADRLLSRPKGDIWATPFFPSGWGQPRGWQNRSRRLRASFISNRGAGGTGEGDNLAAIEPCLFAPIGELGAGE